MIIKNGVGDGTLARVFANHHIGVQSISEPIIGYKSRVEQQGFSIFLPAPMPAGTGENALFVLYNGESEKNFTMNTIFISHYGGSTFNRHIVGRMYKSATAPTTGIYGGVPIAFGNLNVGSSKITDMKAYIWDGSTGTGLTGGSAGTIIMAGIFPPQFTVIELNGSVVVAPGQYIRVTAQAAEATSMCMTISGFLDTPDSSY